MISASIILTLLFSAALPDMPVEASMYADDTAISDWVVLRITNSEKTDGSCDVVLTPPPGVYPFQRGDHVVLCAFDRANRPRPVRWSGDAEEEGHFLYLEMDADKSIHVFCDGVDHDLQTSETQAHWFDTPEDRAVHAFVGGGNLYGWFAVKRDQAYGAGITHLTHQDVPHMPLLHGIGLNLEHIFSGRASDAWRSLYTPRTDPMRFSVEAPNEVRVLWPSETSSWNVDCEMRYVFPGGDALDIEFSATPGEDMDSPEYIVFMWASYQNQSSDRALYFPGIQNGVEKWIRFGPISEDGKAGGVVTYRGAKPLFMDDGYQLFNLRLSREIFFTTPFYYGIIDERTAVGQAGIPRKVMMMFDRSEPIHFAIYNWGYPPTISAWDWQYVLHNPKQGKSDGYQARMLYTEFKDGETAMRLYDAWQESAHNDSYNAAKTVALPDLPHYWSPAFKSFNVYTLANALEARMPKLALPLWRLALMNIETRQTAAKAIYRIYDSRGTTQDRITEWDDLRAMENIGGIAFLHCAMAYHDNGDSETALRLVTEGATKYPEEGKLSLYLGRLLIKKGEMDDGIERLQRAAALEQELAEEAADMLAHRAWEARQATDYSLAERLYRISHALAPTALWHKVYLGETLETMGREDEALAIYQEILRAAPESPYTAEKLDNLFLKNENLKGRIRFWRELHEQYPEATLPALGLGKVLVEGGNYVASRQLLEKLHVRKPDNVEAAFLLARAIFMGGEIEEGLQRLNDVVSMDTQYASPAGVTVAARAQQARESGELLLAERLFRSAALLAPNDFWHKIYLGETLEAIGRDDEALALYAEVLQAVPESPYTAEKLDDLFLKNDKLEERLHFWRALHEQYPEATLPVLGLGKILIEGGDYVASIQLLETLHAREPDNVEAAFLLARAIFMGGEIEEGLQRLNDVVSANARYASPAGATVATRAQQARESEEPFLAERLFRGAVLLAPNDLWHKIYLGETLEAMGRDDEALMSYAEVLQAVPESPYTAERLDALFVRLGRQQNQITHWQQLHQQYPEASLPLLRLGHALRNSGKVEEALEAFEKVLAHTPFHAEALLYAGWMEALLGRMEQGLERIEQALTLDESLALSAAAAYSDAAAKAIDENSFLESEACLRKAVQLAPEDLRYRVQLAETLEATGNSKEALNAYVHVLRHAPDAPRSAARVDAILIAADDAEARVAAWRQLAGEISHSARPVLHLGKALAASGDLNAAANAYRDALVRDPGLEEARLLLDALSAHVGDISRP